MKKMTQSLKDTISVKNCPRCNREILLENNQGECEYCNHRFRFLKKNTWEIFWWTDRWILFRKEDF